MGKKFKVTVNGEVFDVEIEEIGNTKSVPTVKAEQTEEKTVAVSSAPKEKKEEVKKEIKKDVNTKGKKIVAAPLPGKIISVKVKKGDTVKKGNLLLVIEAMKMENEIFASEGGVVSDVLVSAGDYVSTGDKLIILE